jgi:hypothetical protein
MNSKELTTAIDLPVGGADHIANTGIRMPNRDEVERFLGNRLELADLLRKICTKARTVFNSAELSLELYHDPEFDDRYLTLFVRLDPYPADILDRIESFTAEFRDYLDQISDYFLVTTDFRRPGVVNGV